MSTIVAALVRRADELLLVEAQGPSDAEPLWMLPGGQVEDGEEPGAALRRELAEETGVGLVGEPYLAFAVEVDYRELGTSRPYRALTYACEVDGDIQPDDPDGLVRRAAWVRTDEALRRLSKVQWYECEPLRRFLTGAADVGAAYRYRVSRSNEGMVRDAFERIDGSE